MNIITQNPYHRQRFIKYYKNHGGSKTAIRYKISRKTVYKWLERYDGTLESLKDRSRRPHHSPKGHNEQELSQIKKALKKVKRSSN